MLDALRFVQGAVAKKSLVPTLTHFRIKNGRILGSNGMLTLSCPIDLDMDVTPKAEKFMRAIKSCTSTVQLSKTSNNTLFIRSAGFKAYIDCTEEPYPEIQPEGESVEFSGGLLDALRKLERYVGEDDSRRWARGILLRGESAFATNNIVLVEYWLGYSFPKEICIPEPAIQELLRIGEEPTYAQISDNSITFHFDGDRWLRTQAYSTEWPPVTQMLDGLDCSGQESLPEGFFEALQRIKPFVDDMDRVYMSEGRMSTVPSADAGASVDMHVAHKGIYNINQLLLLEGSVETINLSTYPKPSPFFGDGIRGVLAGMKQ